MDVWKICAQSLDNLASDTVGDDAPRKKAMAIATEFKTGAADSDVDCLLRYLQGEHDRLAMTLVNTAELHLLSRKMAVIEGAMAGLDAQQ